MSNYSNLHEKSLIDNWKNGRNDRRNEWTNEGMNEGTNEGSNEGKTP
jgi:hypothetical protein